MKLLPKVSENASNVLASPIETMPFSAEVFVVSSFGKTQIELSHYDNAMRELMANLKIMVRCMNWKAGFWF